MSKMLRARARIGRGTTTMPRAGMSLPGGLLSGPSRLRGQIGPSGLCCLIGLIGLIGLSLCGLLLMPHAAHADSIFSANGLGESIYPTDVRGRGMGTASIAVDDAANLSLLNPAVLSRVERFTLHAEGVPEFRRIEAQGGLISTPRSTNFPLLRLALDVPRVGALGVGLGQYTNVSYELGETEVIQGHEFRQTLEGRNGWSTLTLTWARAVRPDLRLGVDVNFLIGSFVDIWTTTPTSGGLNTTVDSLIVNHSRGPLVRLGGVYAPTDALRLGASIMPGRRIDLRPERRSESGTLRFANEDLELPLTYGLGASYLLKNRWLLAGDLLWTGWEDADIQLSRDNVETQNVARVAIGLEYKADRTGDSRALRDRIAWRAGYYREPWHYRDPDGERLVDHFASLGIGIPLLRSAGFLDLSVEIGSRGDIERNHARERVLRFGIGITLRELISVGRVE